MSGDGLDSRNNVIKDKYRLFGKKKDFFNVYHSVNKFPTDYASPTSYAYQLTGIGSIYTPYNRIF